MRLSPGYGAVDSVMLGTGSLQVTAPPLFWKIGA
jgi:hypothetical protein